MDRAKLAVELAENGLALDIRSNPDKYGLTKTTEGAIMATVKTQREYLDAVTEHVDARHELSLLEAAVTAMEQRKRMIEVLITLHGQQYFAGPSAPRNLGAIWSDYQETKLAALNNRQADKARTRKIK